MPDSPSAIVPPIPLVARLTPRLSDAPQPSSYATLGLAAVDASAHRPATRSRKGPFALVGLLAFAVAVAAALRLDVLRPLAQAPAANPLPAATAAAKPPSQASSSWPPPTAAAWPAAASPVTGASWPLLPTVAASAS